MKRQWSYTLIVFLIALVTAIIWRYWCTPYADDYIYSHTFEVEYLSQSATNTLGHPIASVEDACTSIYRHYLTAPGRLANNLSFIMALLPKWINILIAAFAVAAFAPLMIATAAGVRALNRTFLVACTYLWMWVAFPWDDHMQSLVFTTNYVCSACACLTVLLIFRYTHYLGRISYILALVVTVFASWMHEGFAVPLIAYMVISTLLYKRDKLKMGMIVTALLGFALSFSPGTLGRLLSGSGSQLAFGIRVSDLMLLSPVAILVLLILASIFIKRYKALTLRLWLPSLIAILSTIVVAQVAKAGGRAYWPAEMFATVGILGFFCDFKPRRVLNIALWILPTSVYLAFMIVLIGDQKSVAKDYYFTHQLIKGAQSNLIFTDRKTPDLSWATLGIPIADAYSDWINLYYENQSLGRQGVFALMPLQLENKPLKEWYDIPGNNNFKGITAQMVTDHRIDSLTLKIHLGEVLPSISPLKRIIVDAAARHTDLSSKVVDAKCDFVDVYQGDSLYRITYQLDSYLYTDREILAIDVIDE